MDETDNKTDCKLALNHVEHNYIRPADRPYASRWRNAGKTGDKSDCLAYIKNVWTDMRLLSLRKHLSEASAQDSAA